ncbi:MAG: hypothetical protein HYS43_00810 [Candidatus Liptonbacteria bacterium]|nr:hypothetical protein [Candidatus Liptonbacteria bacterium]
MTRARIDEKTLHHLADLSRFSIDARAEPKLIRDMEKVVDYFQNLQSVSLESGAESRVSARNLRADTARPAAHETTDLLRADEEGYCSVPPVF